MHPFGRPEGDFSTFAKSVKEKDRKKRKIRKRLPACAFRPCFPAAHEFFISGKDGAIERGEESGTECVAPTVFIARRSDQNDQWTTK